MPVETSPTTPTAPPSIDGRRRFVATGVLLVALVAIVAWWWWPTIAGRSDRLDVLVLGDLFIQDAEVPISQQIRQTGRSVEIVALPAGWCTETVAREVISRRPATVVVSSGSGTDCAAALLEELEVLVPTVVAVVQPGRGPTVHELTRWTAAVVDPERLVGVTADSLRLPCLWWDDCEPDGAVEVRDAGGALTSAGAQRVARMIVSEL